MPGAVLHTNLITAGATLTPSTEDTAYPVENIYDWQAPNVFRGTSLTALTILIDFGAATLIDTMAIVNHNFTQAAVVTLKGDNSDPPTTLLASPAWREFDIWSALTATSARYWLLTIADNNTEVLELGQFILGQRTALPVARRIGNRYRPLRERFTIGDETYAGVDHRYFVFDRKRFNPRFRMAAAADLAIFDALDRATYGSVRPFLWIPDSTDPECHYVKKEEAFEPEEIDRVAGGEYVHDYEMEMVEMPRGLDILE